MKITTNNFPVKIKSSFIKTCFLCGNICVEKLTSCIKILFCSPAEQLVLAGCPRHVAQCWRNSLCLSGTCLLTVLTQPCGFPLCHVSEAAFLFQAKPYFCIRIILLM